MSLEQLSTRFRVEEILFENADVSVSRVSTRDSANDRILKIFNAATIEPQPLLQFKIDLTTLSTLTHPNVVKVHEVGLLDGGGLYLVADLVPGRRITEFFGGNNWDLLENVVSDVASGLDEVHRVGLIHGAVRPSNILVTGDGRGVLMEFGPAVVRPEWRGRALRADVHYVAPEVLVRERFDLRSDLYSLGVALYETVTGSRPGYGRPAEEVIRIHREGEIRAVRAINPNVPQRLAELITKLMAREAGGRYSSAAALRRDIRGGRSEVASGGAGSRQPRLLESPIVGRAEQTASIRDLVARARHGEGGGVLVVGPEGAGKSRIVRETALQCQIEGAHVFIGRCPANKKSIYAPFFEILRRMVQLVNPAADSAVELAEILRSVDEKEGRPKLRKGLEFRLFHRIVQSFHDYHGLLTAERGRASVLVLVLEDLQWADPATGELLTFLVGEARQANIAVLGTLTLDREGDARTAAKTFREPEHWLSRARDSGIQIVEVGPLEEVAVREMAESILGQPSLPGEFIRWLVWESGGNPSMVEQTLQFLSFNSVIECREDGCAVLMDRLQKIRLPSGPSGAWISIVDSFDSRLRSIVNSAAVLGRHFDASTLAVVEDRPQDEVIAALTDLVRIGVFRVAEAGGFSFSHLGLRDSVYGLMTERTRAEIHERAGMALEAGFAEARPEVLGQVAYHFARSNQHSRGIEYSIRAGEQAERALAHEQAAEFFRMALDLMDMSGVESGRLEIREKLGDALERADDLGGAMQACQFLLKAVQSRAATGEEDVARITRKIGMVLFRRGDLDAALACFHDAAKAYEDLGNPSETAEILGQMADVLRNRGDLDEAESLTARGETLLASLPPSSVHAWIQRAKGLLFAARGDWSLARIVLDDALKLANDVGASDLARRLSSNLGHSLWKLGEWDKALRVYRETVIAAEAEGDLWGILRATTRVARIELSRGRFSVAEELFAKSLRINQKLGSPDEEAMALMNSGEALEHLGQWDGAMDRYQRCLDLEGFDEANPIRVAVYIPLARLVAKRGEIPRAMRYAQTVHESARRSHDEELLAEAGFVLAQIERERENFDEATGLLVRSMELFQENEAIHGTLRAWVRSADLLLMRGEIEEAEARIIHAEAIARRLGDRISTAQCIWLRAKSETLKGNREVGSDLFAESESMLRDLETPFELARLMFDRGLLTEDPEEAERDIRSAITVFETLKAPLDLERARGVLFRISPSGRAAKPTNVVGLYEIVKILNSTIDSNDLLERVLDIVLKRLRAERGFIVLTDPITGVPKRRLVRYGEGSAVSEADQSRFAQSVIDSVILSGEPVITPDAKVDERFSSVDGVKQQSVASVLAVPLVIKNRSAGAIYVDHSEARQLFAGKDLEFLEAFSDQAAIAIENARLYEEIEDARARLSVENETLRNEVLVEKHLDSIVGHSEAVARIQFTVKKAAASNSTVLIRGESGTGKGLVARIIHSIGPRAKGAFIKFNCAALPETLAESELFGHEKGAFTGADRRKPGRFELADGGTIFLDEVGKINLSMQAKLLRVVEEKEFERLGGTDTIRTDVKIVAATNLNLEDAIRAGEFREDLFYRLNIIPIVLPPLRERKEDVTDLVEYFVRSICRDLGIEQKRLSAGVLEMFHQYDWPGNVRELEATIHRAIVMASGDVLTQSEFYSLLSDPHKTIMVHVPSGELPDDVLHPLIGRLDVDAELYSSVTARVDRQLIEHALRESGGRIRETARRLGIARNTLKAKIEKYGINPASS